MNSFFDIFLYIVTRHRKWTIVRRTSLFILIAVAHKGVLLLPPLGPRGETHSLEGEGVGGPNSFEGTDTLLLYVHNNPSTQAEIWTVQANTLASQHRHTPMIYATPQWATPHPNEICHTPNDLMFFAKIFAFWSTLDWKPSRFTWRVRHTK